MESSHSCWKQTACQDQRPSPGRGGTHYFDTEHVPTGPVMDKPFTHLRNETHRAISILARATGTAPQGPGTANSLISLIGEQSTESGYKFSSSTFLGTQRVCDLWPHFKEEQIVDTKCGSSRFSRGTKLSSMFVGEPFGRGWSPQVAKKSQQLVVG